MISSHDSDTKKIVLTSILCGIAFIILLTGLLQITLYLSIFCSIGILIPVLDNYGYKYWILGYITVSLLGLILSPDLEITLTYICMGWYVGVKVKIDRHKSKIVKTILKGIIFLLSSYIMYYISVAVFGGVELDMGSDVKISEVVLIVSYVLMFILNFTLLDITINIFRNRIISLLLRRISKII